MDEMLFSKRSLGTLYWPIWVISQRGMGDSMTGGGGKGLPECPFVVTLLLDPPPSGTCTLVATRRQRRRKEEDKVIRCYRG